MSLWQLHLCYKMAFVLNVLHLILHKYVLISGNNIFGNLFVLFKICNSLATDFQTNELKWNYSHWIQHIIGMRQKMSRCSADLHRGRWCTPIMSLSSTAPRVKEPQLVSANFLSLYLRLSHFFPCNVWATLHFFLCIWASTMDLVVKGPRFSFLKCDLSINFISSALICLYLYLSHSSSLSFFVALCNYFSNATGLIYLKL